MPGMTGWTEIGDRVFVRRYAFYDQNIGVVLGGDECHGHRHALDATSRLARSSTTCAS